MTTWASLGAIHPGVKRQVFEIYGNLGFSGADEWDEFWAKQNTGSGGYREPDKMELRERLDLISRAQAGEKIDLKGIYASIEVMGEP